MYDNYSMPDPRFYKLYANKFRDMHSLRTEDIDGAQPKKQTFERNDFLNRYYDKVVSHNQVVQSNGAKNLNYWSLPQQDANSSPVRQKGGMSYNPSTAQMNYSKPEDYHLPNSYKIGNRQNPPPMNQYQQQAPQQYGNQGYSNNSSAIRNPMYSDFDYNNRQQQQQQYGNQNQYQNSPQRTLSKGGNNNIYVRDSLDALQMQYNNSPYQTQGQSPQYPPQNNQSEVQDFKQDWLNFYGVESAPTQKQNVNNVPRQNQSPVKQADPTIRASAAKFYGEGPSEEDQFQKNLHAFYGADSSLPVRNAKGNLARVHTNVLKKDVKLYNPLIHAPMLHYSKDPSKFEKPKIMDVREQWQYKQNLQKFYDV